MPNSGHKLNRVLNGVALRTAGVAACCLVSACAVGPDYKRPDLPNTNGYAPGPLPTETVSAPGQHGAAQRFRTTQDIAADWWKMFQSPELNQLIEKAFAANPSIESAQAALRQAQENVYAQQGFFFPTIQANYSPSRTKLSGNTGGNSPGVQGDGSVIATTSNTPANQGGTAPFNGPVIYNFHTAQLTVGFVPDVFGANRRAVEGLQAQAAAQRFQLEAAYITLASNIVGAAIQEASLRAQIAATKQSIEVSSKSLDILRQQLRLGYAMRLDVAAQESALAQAKTALPPLEKQLGQTRDLIRMLAGSRPDQDVEETFELASLHLPEDLPLSVPSKLIEQRPDVRVAEEQVHAASAAVGVAIANRLPSFSISGTWGGNAAHFSQMFWDSGRFFSLVGNVTQPLFDGGTLLHRKLAADQAFRQAIAQYRSTVLTAFQNTADTLQALESDAHALQAAVEAEQAARVTLDIVRMQHRLGHINYLALLSAEQAYQQALIGLVQAQASRLGDTAALFQALGGGWWNRDGHDA